MVTARRDAASGNIAASRFGRTWNESALIGCLLIDEAARENPAAADLPLNDIGDPFFRECLRAIRHVEHAHLDEVVAIVATVMQIPWPQVFSRLADVMVEARWGCVFPEMVPLYVNAIREHAQRHRLRESIELAARCCDSGSLSSDEIREHIAKAVAL